VHKKTYLSHLKRFTFSYNQKSNFHHNKYFYRIWEITFIIKSMYILRCQDASKSHLKKSSNSSEAISWKFFILGIRFDLDPSTVRID